MAAFAACKRIIQSSPKSGGLNFTLLRGLQMCNNPTITSSSLYNSIQSPRNITQLVQSNGKRVFLVDTLALAEMQKVQMTHDANLAKFKSEVTSSQGHHFSMLQHEAEKLKVDIEKMRSELRYEIDKVTAGQRLDLNLERGRIRDELANQGQETSNLTNKLDREIHALRAQVEAAKYDIVKYCIGTLVSISAVGLAVIRILM
ncbi:putative coiled-coil domain-containing protein 90-like protein [Heracleum sosnowskyi]|uniref:Coiled-coil domain-containing protein 90-like protein n=1 Tax=Heracleum sosnowskyi TaxID=360622 RepID=A0AAD8GZG8_9APIA|nr:putative coiled-coil domain-containing protein 90-like protein [Heracleum sosnowskyi]